MRNGPDAGVTIVTGIPRSGTSLVMQMLAAGGHPIASDGARRADADNPRGYFELETAKRLARDAAWLPELAGRALKLVHTLLPALPTTLQYRVLLIRRRLDEVLDSQRAMLTRRGAAPDPEEDARLLPALEAQVARLEGWLAAQDGLAWIRIDHAELLARPTREAARLADFLGGGLDARAMAACVDPSLHRQRREP